MTITEAEVEAAATFQQRVDAWLIDCFGETIARDKRERDHRLLEEALETVQSGQCTRCEAHQLVDYVFDRPVGERKQEVGGVMNTLAAWCLAYDIDLNDAAETELARVWTKVDAIRAKQAAKPKHSPLPEAAREHGGGWRPEGKRWRHKKRGSIVREIGRGKLQTAAALSDMEPLVLYVHEDAGTLWARAVAEFEDGRFEPLPPPDSEGGR